MGAILKSSLSWLESHLISHVMTSENVVFILLTVSHTLCVCYRYFVNIFSMSKCIQYDICGRKKTDDNVDNNNISKVLWKSLTFIFSHTIAMLISNVVMFDKFIFFSNYI